MSTKERALHEAPRKKRPSIFWWSLAHLLAIAFAVAAWTTCLYIFNYPEKPQNYEILRKLGRLTPVTDFPSLDAPNGTPADPEELYRRIFPQSEEDLADFNLQFRRNYLRNYRDSDPRFVLYAEGDYLVDSIRLLSQDDFFQPGLMVRLHAQVQPDEFSAASAYPVYLDLTLPFASDPDRETFAPGDPVQLRHIDHRAAVLHAAKTTVDDEPAVLVTAVPLSFANLKDRSGEPLPLSPPTLLNLAADFHAKIAPGSPGESPSPPSVEDPEP